MRDREHLDLVLLRRVFEHDLHAEAVELRLRQREDQIPSREETRAAPTTIRRIPAWSSYGLETEVVIT